MHHGIWTTFIIYSNNHLHIRLFFHCTAQHFTDFTNLRILPIGNRKYQIRRRFHINAIWIQSSNHIFDPLFHTFHFSHFIQRIRTCTIVKNRNNDNTPWIRNLQSHPSTTFHKICIDNDIFILKPFSHKTASKIFIHTLLFFDGNLLDQDLRHFFRDLSIFCHFIIWTCDTYHTNNLIGYDNGIVHPFKTSLISIMRMDDQFLQPVVNDPLCSFMLLTDTLLISTGDNNPFFIHHINFVIDDRVQFLYDYLSIMSRKLHIILPPQVVCISLRNSLCKFFKFSLQSPGSCADTDFGSLLT